MKRRYITFIRTALLCVFVLSVVQMDVVHADAVSDQISKSIFGDKLSQKPDNVSYMEEMLAGLITAIPRWLIDMFSLEDINMLVFLQNDWVYHIFPTGVWISANTFYSLALSTCAYLMVLGFIVWGVIILTRSASSQAQGTAKDMARGFAIYTFGIWLGNYLFELIFKINEFLVKFALYGMQSAGIPPTLNFLNLFMILQNTPSLGSALMFFFVVFSIGILNYQYALRMLMLVILIILFPVCAYTSIFPSSRKAFDMWFREFCSQVFMNGGHALGYALFLILLKNQASNWVLFAFLLGLPQITGVVRMILGAPGGVVSGSMGLGSVTAVTQMLRSSKGGMAGNGGGGVPLPSTASNVASSALGIVASSSNLVLSGMGKAMGKLNTVTPPKVKSIAKMAGMATAITGGAMVGGALIGERGAAVGAAGGLALGNKSMSRNKNSGAQVMNSTYDGENHRMNVRLPLSPNTSHERAWEVAQNKTPEGYNLQSVNLTPKGWMANMQKSGAGDSGQPVSAKNTSATPSPTRNIPLMSNTSNSSSRGGFNASSSVSTSSRQSVGGQQVPQPVTTGPRRPGGFNSPPPSKNGTVNPSNTSQTQTQMNATPTSTNQQANIPSPTITRPPNPPTSSK